MNIFKN